MDALFHIEQTGWVYPAMYISAFCLSALYLLYESRKCRWPVDSVVLMLGITIISAVIGSKIVFLNPQMLTDAVLTGMIPEVKQKSLLGGLTGGLFGMLVAIRMLGLPMAVSDKIAVILPLGMAIGRIGCLFAGCCFGRITDVPWGITYSQGSPAHFHHILSEIADPGSTQSLAVHPVPVYEIIICVLIAVILYRSGSVLKIAGNRIFALLACYSFLRFGSEFFRQQNHDYLFGNVQITTLLAGLILLLIIISREWYSLGKESLSIVSGKARWFVIILLLFLAIALDQWFSPVETLLTRWTIFGLIIWNLVRTFSEIWTNNRIYKPIFYFAISALFITAFVTTIESDSTKKSTFRYGLGYFSGKYGAKNVDYGPATVTEQCGCDGCSNVNSYPEMDEVNRTYHYRGGNFSIESVNERRAGRVFTYGLRFIGGMVESPEMSSQRRTFATFEQNLYIVNPYFRFDSEYYGIGAGLNAGRIPFRPLQSPGRGTAYDENDSIVLMPSTYFRILRRDSFFIDGKFNEAEHGSFPVYNFQLGLGLGFYHNDQYGAFRAGLSERGYYLEPDIPLFNHFSVYGRFTITRNQDDANLSKNHLSIGVRYTP